MNHRLDRIIDELDRRGLGGLLVSSPDNRRYLSGFTGSAGSLLVTRDQPILAADSRYTEQAHHQAPDFRVVPAQPGWDWLVKALLKSGVTRLGFESEHLTVAEYHRLLAAINQESALSLVPAPGIVEDLRVVKEQEELARLQRAVDASDSAMDAVVPTLGSGLTEQEVAWRMEQAMRESGADGSSFNVIVASGPNGAMPHHRPTGRTLRTGEPVVIDLGAKVGGYCSDLARTVVLGQEDAAFRRIYDLVLGAQLTALAILRPGMTGGDCDRLARTVVQAAGYGDNFGHGLGHGVGLAVHEAPRLHPDSEDILAVGTVFTVEPGIYIPGWGGVRIEDLVLLEEGGARPLSKARK